MNPSRGVEGLLAMWVDGKTIIAVALGLAAIVALLAVGRIPLMYNVQNLAVRRRTTALTLMAFVLVIGLLVVMLAFVNGMSALTNSSGRPGNVVILSEGSTDESFSNLGYSDVGDIENQPGVMREGNRPLVSREAYLIVNQPLPVLPDDREEPNVRNLWGFLPRAKRPSADFCKSAASMIRRSPAKCTRCRFTTAVAGFPKPACGRFPTTARRPNQPTARSIRRRPPRPLKECSAKGSPGNWPAIKGSIRA
ncbi:MAG: hypothetical protein QM775_02120 [Pirellulales bacterium]